VKAWEFPLLHGTISCANEALHLFATKFA